MTLNFNCEHRYASGFDLKIEFETGSGCTALLGPSGSGKTTVLSIISGTLDPQSGKVVIGDRVVVDVEKNLLLNPEDRMVGCVFQDALLFPHLDVRQNMEFGKRFRKKSNREIELDSVVEVLELHELLERMPHELSGGQQQRVALGRAIASGPELLLLDEPLSSLDRPLGKRVLTFLKTALAEWKIPAVYVTHSQEEVEFIADQTITLDQGCVAENQDELINGVRRR